MHQKSLCERCGEEVHVSMLQKHAQDYLDGAFDASPFSNLSSINEQNNLVCPKALVQCHRASCRVIFFYEDRRFHSLHECKARDHRDKLIKKKTQRQRECTNESFCVTCRQTVKGISLLNHERIHCPQRLVQCGETFLEQNRGCLKVMSYSGFIEHLEKRQCEVLKQRDSLVSEKKRMFRTDKDCPQCGQQGLSLKTLPLHQQEMCSRRTVKCPNQGMGCTDSVLAEEVVLHMKRTCLVTMKRAKLIESMKTRESKAPCPLQCGAVLSKKLISLHCKKECAERFESCRFNCGAQIKAKDATAHHTTPLFYFLHNVPICRLVIRRNKLAENSVQRRNIWQNQ